MISGPMPAASPIVMPMTGRGKVIHEDKLPELTEPGRKFGLRIDEGSELGSEVAEGCIHHRDTENTKENP